MRTDDAGWVPQRSVVIAYSFGTGRGTPHTWHDAADHDADGDGRADAIALDFDGDGRADDAMWDSDGDGVADTALLDLDDDGRADHGYIDPSGAGTWNARGSLPGQTTVPPQPGRGPRPADGGPAERAPDEPTELPEPTDQEIGWTDAGGKRHVDRVTEDVDHDGEKDAAWVDFDLDGDEDELVVDPDHDGVLDQLVMDADGDGRMETAYLDGDEDGTLDTMLVDTDGDGLIDRTHRAGDTGFVDPVDP
jgi:hypothetical protein